MITVPLMSPYSYITITTYSSASGWPRARGGGCPLPLPPSPPPLELVPRENP
jgi:hypothetical protein